MLNALATSETREHLIAEVAQLRRTLVDPGAGQEQRTIIDSDEVAGYCRRAEDAPHPMVRMVLLEKAAKVATKRQLDTEAKRITALMQAIDPADLGLQVIRTSTSILTWIPESFLDPSPELACRYSAVLHRPQCADRSAARQPRQRRTNRQRIAVDAERAAQQQATAIHHKQR
ncbi:hypothetical protein [Nocardia farcinica]